MSDEPQRSSTDDRVAWRAYWGSAGLTVAAVATYYKAQRSLFSWDQQRRHRLRRSPRITVVPSVA